MTIPQRIRVPAGFCFGILYLLLARPRPLALGAGMLLAAAGLALRLWASGCLPKFEDLALSGPYRWTRNPLYLGSFLAGAGFTLAAWNLWLALLFGIFFPLLYLPVMRREEGELREAFQDRFRHYQERVPLFWPRPPASPLPEGVPFSWQRVGRNREYKAVLGFLIVAGLLLVKLWWR